MLSKRNRTALYQAAVKSNREEKIEPVYAQLDAILPLLGAQSHSRQMIYRIGLLLLQDQLRVVAPSCPDYSHAGGKYTFNHLGTGVPLLTQLHLKLFDQLTPHLPHAQFEIVIADQEAEDTSLCAMTQTTESEFRARITASARATNSIMGERPYRTHLMTKRFPSLRNLEKRFELEIVKDNVLAKRVASDTMARTHMYEKIGVSNYAEMKKRTLRTAAQYCALAYLAATERFLVCNHETVNLGWYTRHGAAVLHNAVSIY